MRLLAQAGGINCKETISRAMKKLMTTKVALQFNWVGKGDKQAFGKMNLKGIVFGKLVVLVDAYR